MPCNVPFVGAAIRNGGRPPSPTLIFAPIFDSGSTTRAIGLLLSDSSPTNSDSNGCAARIPESIRIVDPEFPQSNAVEGALNPPSRPTISKVPFCCFDISQPSARKQRNVLWQSAPVEKFSNREVPLASAASIAYRCEIDLSPGSRIAPTMFFAGLMIWIESVFIPQFSSPSVRPPVFIL
jgi:hypothetical protein